MESNKVYVWGTEAVNLGYKHLYAENVLKRCLLDMKFEAKQLQNYILSDKATSNVKNNVELCPKGCGQEKDKCDLTKTPCIPLAVPFGLKPPSTPSERLPLPRWTTSAPSGRLPLPRWTKEIAEHKSLSN